MRPDWEFFTTARKTWAWTNRRGESSNGEFLTVKDAVENAKVRGFDGATMYWTVATDQGTTHYRPGQPPTGLTDQEQPN